MDGYEADDLIATYTRQAREQGADVTIVASSYMVLEAMRAAEQLAETSGSWAGLAASLQAEAAIDDSYAWVNAVRALTRPVLTLLLWLITWLVFVASPEAEQVKIVETSTFAATAATLWWFGDRGAQRTAR